MKEELDAKILRDLMGSGLTEAEALDALSNIRKLRKEKEQETPAPYFQHQMNAPKKANPMVKTARKGGYVKVADGCAKRGKTKGRIV